MRKKVIAWATRGIAVLGLVFGSGHLVWAAEKLTPAWTYTTQSHFTLVGLVFSGQWMYRESIGATGLHRDRAFAWIVDWDRKSKLICFDRRNGRQQWRRNVELPLNPIARVLPVVNDLLIIPAWDPASRRILVLAFSIEDGRLAWQRDLGGSLLQAPFGDVLEVDAIRGRIVLYVPQTLINNYIEISAANGEVQQQSSYRGYFFGSGTRTFQNLLFAFDGEPLSQTAKSIVAIDRSTGGVVWRRGTDGHWTSPPTLAAGQLLIASKSVLMALNPQDGEPRWVAPLRGAVPPKPKSPAAIEDHIFLTQQVSGSTFPDAHWMVTRHRSDTGGEDGYVSFGQRAMAPQLSSGKGRFILGADDRRVEVIDITRLVVVAAGELSRTSSRFHLDVGAPSLLIGADDNEAFLAIGRHGTLGYFRYPKQSDAPR